MRKNVEISTEQASKYMELEKMSTSDILYNINNEDKKVALAVENAIPQIKNLIDEVEKRFLVGGRLFYIGAGTSGRLGVVDASEILPTFGVTDKIIGIIAGGDSAIRKAVEFAEDDIKQAWIDLKIYNPNNKDTIIGIAASGFTPYVIGGIVEAKKNGILTGCITSSKNSLLATVSDLPIEVIAGPEFITGSTRMKSGTAQKMILNMISTALMIKIGRVSGNMMVNMQLSNNKLIKRGIRFLMTELNVSQKKAAVLLKKYGSVKDAIVAEKK